jgi:DNA replication and repair protein RecF
MNFVETAWKSFRNLKPRRQQWQPGLNVIFGSNGSGKTNLLESFNVLSGWGAFPAAGARVSSLIAWGIDGERAFLLGRAAGERDVEVQAYVGARMSLRASNEKVTHSELRALLPSLSFLPHDIGLLDGSPSIRRLFLDKLCALFSPLYARRLSEYKQLVRQRTTLLRQDRKWRDAATALRATVPPLAQFGGWVRGVRQKVVDLLAKTLEAREEGGEKGGARQDFPSSPGSPSSDFLSRPLCNVSFTDLLPFRVEVDLEFQGTAGLEDPVQDMAAALAADFERERQAGSVLVGPHRDDLLFSCLGRPASQALSRGQKRRLVVATILGSGLLIEAKLRIKPILLLDDVAAELDAEGRELMGRALADTGWQVFSTGVEDPFDKVSDKTLWRVKEGKVEVE